MSAYAISAPCSRRALRTVAVILAMALCTCSATLAQAESLAPQGGLVAVEQPMSVALARYASSAEVTPASTRRVHSAQAQVRRSFIKRHPVWTGLIGGGGIGTTMAATAWGAEGAFVGLYSGAAVGALVGWLMAR